MKSCIDNENDLKVFEDLVGKYNFGLETIDVKKNPAITNGLNVVPSGFSQFPSTTTTSSVSYKPKVSIQSQFDNNKQVNKVLEDESYDLSDDDE